MVGMECLLVFLEEVANSGSSAVDRVDLCLQSTECDRMMADGSWAHTKLFTFLCGCFSLAVKTLKPPD